MKSLLNKLILIPYNLALKFVLFLIRKRGHKISSKFYNYLKEREFPQIVWRVQPSPHKRRIWFHASSGEIEYIKPIIKLWKDRHPDDLIILTYFSTSARPMIDRFPELDAWAPLPFDLTSSIKSFLNVLRPNVLIISRTDLWPNLLYELGNTPKILVASTWSEGNYKSKGFGRYISKWCLLFLNRVCVVSIEDKNCLKSIAPNSSIAVTGDPRFDQVFFRIQQKRPISELLLNWKQNHFLLIAGSTWPEDEIILIDALSNKNLNNKTTPDRILCKTLIVPHEIDEKHLNELQNNLLAKGFKYSLWSQSDNDPHFLESSVIIFDEKGWLADLYQIADLAFIGGSFKKQVHSVMEALGFGIPVMVGPYYKNNREAMEFSKLSSNQYTFVTVTSEVKEVLNTIQSFMTMDNYQKSELKQQIKDEFLKHCSASEATLIEIEKLLQL